MRLRDLVNICLRLTPDMFEVFGSFLMLPTAFLVCHWKFIILSASALFFKSCPGQMLKGPNRLPTGSSSYCQSSMGPHATFLPTLDASFMSGVSGYSHIKV